MLSEEAVYSPFQQSVTPASPQFRAKIKKGKQGGILIQKRHATCLFILYSEPCTHISLYKFGIVKSD